MVEFKERAKELADGAQDIARDRLDSFRKLSREQQILIVVFAGIVIVVLVVWMMLPGKLDIEVSLLLQEGVMDNEVIVTNIGDKPLGKLKIILDDRYEYEVPAMTDKTMSISVTRFKPVGNPDGNPPPPDMVPKKVKVIAKGARYVKEFE